MLKTLSSPKQTKIKKTGRTFYVAANGNDANNGRSPSTPWQSIGKVTEYAFSTGLKGGDRILFKGVDTFNGQLYISNEATPYSRKGIEISSYGGGKATLQNTGSGNRVAILYNQSFRIKNLKFTHPDYSVAGNAIELFVTGVSDFTNIQILNCEVDGADIGIRVYAYGGSKFTNLLIQGNRVTNCKRYGIYANSEASAKYLNQAAIRYNNVDRVIGNGSTEDGGVGNGIVLGDCKDSVIEWNFADGAACTGGVANNLMWLYNARNSTIKDNKAINGSGQTGRFDRGAYGLDIDCNDCIIERNFAYNCQGEGVFLAYGNNNTIRHNILIDCAYDNNGQGVFHIDGGNAFPEKIPALNLRIYNNTVVIRKKAVAATFDPFAVINTLATNTAIISNNIFYTSQSTGEIIKHATSSPNIRFYGNDYYYTLGTPQYRTNGTTYTGVSAWRTATGQELLTGTNYGQETDPLFVNNAGNNPDDFKLQAGSTLGSGLDLTALFAINPGLIDYFRNSIASVISGIGADSSRSVTQYATPNELTQLLNTSLAYWRLDASPWTEAKGITSYSLGTAGTVTTGTALSTGSTNSASIGGATSNLNLSDTSLLHLPDECTIVLTFQKTLATATNGTATLIGKWDAGANQRGWHLQLEYPSGQATSERLQFQHTTNGQSGTQATLSSGYVTPRNSKRLLILQRSVSDNFLRVSLDNGTFSSTTSPTIHQSTARFAIGGRYNSGTAAGGFTGLIDNVGIWNYILSASQLSLFWDSGNFRQL